MAALPRCTCCGQTLKPATPAKAATIVDTASLSDTDLKAYYKRSAPAENCRFCAREDLGLSPDLRGKFLALADATIPLAEHKRQYRSLCERARLEMDATAKTQTANTTTTTTESEAA